MIVVLCFNLQYLELVTDYSPMDMFVSGVNIIYLLESASFNIWTFM